MYVEKKLYYIYTVYICLNLKYIALCQKWTDYYDTKQDKLKFILFLLLNTFGK